MAGIIDLLKGTVTWFDVRRGFGFITPEDGGENVFVHQSSIKAVGYRSLAVGEAVEFGVFVGNDGCRRAVNVTGPGGAYINGRRYFGGACYNCGEVGHMAMNCKSNVVGTRLGFCNNCKEMGHFARECPATRIKPSSSISNHLESSNLDSVSPFSLSVSLPRDYRKEVIRDLLVRFPENMDCKSNVVGTRLGSCNNCKEMGHFARECPATQINPSSSISNHIESSKLDSISPFSPSVSLPSDYRKEVIRDLLVRFPENMDCHKDDYDEMKFLNGGELRNWAELPRDVLWVIYKKIAAVDILMTAQLVCRPWQQLSRELELWRHIVVPDDCMDIPSLNSLIMLAVNRSEGCVEEFHLECSVDDNDELIAYLSDRAPMLRRLRLISVNELTETALSQSLNKFPLLEELEISFCEFSNDLVGLICAPQLKSFKLNGQSYTNDTCSYDSEDGYSDTVAFSIAKNMPQLQRLQLIGNSLTNKGLLAILDGCPNLRHLDVRACLDVCFDESMEKKCAVIKDLRLPGDSTDDYEFDGLLRGPAGLNSDHCGGSGYFDFDNFFGFH